MVEASHGCHHCSCRYIIPHIYNSFLMSCIYSFPQLVSDTVGMMYQSVSGAKETMTGAVLGAKESITGAVTGAKETMAGAKETMTGAMMAAVFGGVEMTQAAASGWFSSFMGTGVGQMVSSGVGLALSHSENWVDHNLPLSDRELGQYE